MKKVSDILYEYPTYRNKGFIRKGLRGIKAAYKGDDYYDYYDRRQKGRF